MVKWENHSRTVQYKGYVKYWQQTSFWLPRTSSDLPRTTNNKQQTTNNIIDQTSLSSDHSNDGSSNKSIMVGPNIVDALLVSRWRRLKFQRGVFKLTKSFLWEQLTVGFVVFWQQHLCVEEGVVFARFRCVIDITIWRESNFIHVNTGVKRTIVHTLALLT